MKWLRYMLSIHIVYHANTDMVVDTAIFVLLNALSWRSNSREKVSLCVTEANLQGATSVVISVLASLWQRFETESVWRSGCPANA